MNHQKSELKMLSPEELITEYEKLARARGKALSDNDPQSANRAFDGEVSIRRELKARNSSEMMRLLSLVDSDDPWVRLDSAVPALFFAPEKAERVLRELTAHQGMLAAVAVITLQQWKKGKLKDI